MLAAALDVDRRFATKPRRRVAYRVPETTVVYRRTDLTYSTCGVSVLVCEGWDMKVFQNTTLEFLLVTSSPESSSVHGMAADACRPRATAAVTRMFLEGRVFVAASFNWAGINQMRKIAAERGSGGERGHGIGAIVGARRRHNLSPHNWRARCLGYRARVRSKQIHNTHVLSPTHKRQPSAAPDPLAANIAR